MAPVHLILGDDEFLRERVRLQLTSEIREQAEVTVSRVKAGEVTQSELLELLSPSLFAERRVIVLEHFEDAGKEPATLIAEAAREPIEGMYLLICHAGGGRQKSMVPKLKKLAQVHEVFKLKANERPGWVTAEFRSHGVNTTPDVIHALLDGVGSDLRELASAVSQLVADNPDGIDASTVRKFYDGIAEVSGFDIADLAVSGQTARAVASTRRALQLGTSPVALATALSMKVGAIARLYGSLRVNSRELAGELGMAPFIVEKTSKVARKWSGDAVSKAVILMADLDASVKGQGGDAEFAIEDAVRKVAQLAG
ncbi:DNA polymerase III subunit delta [Corynebacterium gerontici]|uniref:DNA polymerase III subunit delta n=1 Tax=Corynebacterium gerontici TaxID=2079234 RepID=UPI000F4DA602|nr:DNA polymerase III subunit delta [Corynebacterium gerontici]